MRIFLVALIGSILACVDADLCVAPCEEQVALPPDNVVALEGTACTADPGSVLFPYKVLFVVDLSGSNEESDPDDNRALAVQRVIESYIENRAVSYAVIGFSSEAERVTGAFTRDFDLLVPGVVDTLRQDEGATNYLDTLDLVYQFIDEDASTLPEAERARTRYDVQWLSDGVPFPCQRVEPIVTATAKVMELKEKHGFFDLTLSTTRLFYDNAMSPEGCEDLTPTDYLEPMAETGEGTFQNLTADELAFKIGFSEIFRRFEARQFFVINHSRVARDGILFPDSDQDGLPDMDESEPDPTASDWDFDGCSDRVDQELLPNVGLCSQFCADEMTGGLESLRDSDTDGIPDCAEQTLGYQRFSIDSDKDGFSDFVELRFGTNPLDNRTVTSDSDGDGTNDADEIRLGRNPVSPEVDPDFAFQYAPLQPVASATPGTNCFSFKVDNVQLVETMETDSTRYGENRICAYLIQSSVDDPFAEPTVTEACTRALYIEEEDGPGFKLPSNGVLSLEPDDFAFPASPFASPS